MPLRAPSGSLVFRDGVRGKVVLLCVQPKIELIELRNELIIGSFHLLRLNELTDSCMTARIPPILVTVRAA